MTTGATLPLFSDELAGKRLAFFMTALNGGGAERVMLTLADEFAKRGACVDLVVTRARGELCNSVPPRVRLVDLGVKRIASSVFPLVRYIRKNRPVSIVSAMSAANVIAVAARLLAGVGLQLVLVEHTTLSASKGARKTLRSRMLPFFMSVTYRNADALVAVSDGVARDLALSIGISRERIRVIYNPVIGSAFFEKIAGETEHPWFDDPSLQVVLGLGRLTKAKDFELLIRAFDLLRSERSSARLVIFGEGEERAALEKLVVTLGLSDYVDLPGFVANPYPYLRRSSVFALSSRWEGLPTVLIEALACGCPIVSTDCPSGPREILNGGNTFPLVGVGDVLGLFLALESQIDRRGSSTPFVDERFSVDCAVSQYVKCLGLGS